MVERFRKNHPMQPGRAHTANRCSSPRLYRPTIVVIRRAACIAVMPPMLDPNALVVNQPPNVTLLTPRL